MRTVPDATIFTCGGRKSDLGVVQVTDPALAQFVELVKENAPAYAVEANVQQVMLKMLHDAELTRTRTSGGELVHLHDPELGTYLTFKVGENVVSEVRSIEYPQDIRIQHNKGNIGWFGISPEAWDAFNVIADRRFREKNAIRTTAFLMERAQTISDSVRHHKAIIADDNVIVYDGALRIRYRISLTRKMLEAVEDTLVYEVQPA